MEEERLGASQHPQRHGPPRGAHALRRTPVAQDLGVGCGLARKDNAFALLHRLWLDGQGHRGRVCKAADAKSGPFLFPGFRLPPRHIPSGTVHSGLGVCVCRVPTPINTTVSIFTHSPPRTLGGHLE